MVNFFRDAFVSIIIGIICNLISAYLFYIGILDINKLIFISIGVINFIIFSIILDVKRDLEEQKIDQKRLIEKLKIYEQLIDIKSDKNYLKMRLN